MSLAVIQMVSQDDVLANLAAARRLLQQAAEAGARLAVLPENFAAMGRRDLAAPQQAYDDFSRVVQRYPESRYADDARQRMVDLRNLFARHEMDTALYYMRRGAWLSAVGRAQYVLETYPQSEFQNDAVAVLAASLMLGSVRLSPAEVWRALIGGGDGTAGIAASSSAGAAVATPVLIAEMVPAFKPMAPAATSLVATAVIVTSILVPILTSIWSRKVKARAAKIEILGTVK